MKRFPCGEPAEDWAQAHLAMSRRERDRKRRDERMLDLFCTSMLLVLAVVVAVVLISGAGME